MKKTLLLLLSACIAVLMVGCNTMQGMGKDVKRMGEAVENAAKK
ncbi:entericidin B [Noviherbaspirillum humi]|uniref:Entericidin B n=1 Tax=Noviherbaspirillum humi TaxID=1688639 RepID=A0A239KQH9_9BURK|nr:entericidin A/B family lipoprotein [Noviherbaspirillum humi]SNT20647.1 entericidin B [Noviherbaspirillum humi]